MTIRNDIIYFAGATGPEASGGSMAFAFIATTENPYHSDTQFLAPGHDASWHTATYHALTSALEWWQRTDKKSSPIFVTDNQLVVKQMGGQCQVKGGHYIEALEDALDAIAVAFPQRHARVRFSWVPQNQNLASPLAHTLLAQEGITPWSYIQKEKA